MINLCLHRDGCAEDIWSSKLSRQEEASFGKRWIMMCQDIIVRLKLRKSFIILTNTLSAEWTWLGWNDLLVMWLYGMRYGHFFLGSLIFKRIMKSRPETRWMKRKQEYRVYRNSSDLLSENGSEKPNKYLGITCRGKRLWKGTKKLFK